MKSLSIALLLIVAIAGPAGAQSISDTLAKVSKIKLLESTRDDVKRILRGYEAGDDDHHYQNFSSENLSIEVTYSSGRCAADYDDEDASEIWSVKEWSVTRIEIELSEPIKLRDAGLKLATFKREPRFPDDVDSLVFYDKNLGIAVKTTEEGVEKLIFFPPRASTNKLCRISSAAKGFYVRKGWFSQDRPYDYACILLNLPADVHEMTLSALEIDLSSINTISVTADAIDPESDVLTYSYKVSGGRIVGTGASVIWDLAGMAPGTYTITVGVDDGAGIVGKTVTKTVTVK